MKQEQEQEHVSPLEPGEEPRAGDLVQVLNGPWGTAIIHKVEGDVIHLLRPHIRLDGIGSGLSHVANYTEHFSTYAKSLMFWRHADGRLYNRPRVR